MDASAISKIEDLSILASGNAIPEQLKFRLAALPGDVQLHDLEKFLFERVRFRGVLGTDSIADFVAYVQRHGSEAPIAAAPGQTGAPGFIDAEKLSAHVLFNLGTREKPGHADDKAVLALKATAPYAAALAINGKPLQQKDAIDWLEDWAEQVTYSDAPGNPIAAAAAIAALRRITIRATSESTNVETDFRATRTALEDVEAAGAGGLPAEVRFSCVPYTGLAGRVLRFRLAVLTGGDKPVVSLRMRNLEAEKEAIAQDFKRVLLSELEGYATLTIGTFTP